MKGGKIAALLAVLVLFATCDYAAAGCAGGGRYEINRVWDSVLGQLKNSGTVTDCRTGLIWLQNTKCTETLNSIPNPDGVLSWSDVRKWMVGLKDGKCGLADGSFVGDWRLPTKTEWMAMVQSANNQNFTNPSLTNGAGTGPWTEGDVFNNVEYSYYWSSTTNALNPSQAEYINLTDGSTLLGDKTSANFVWPVRAEQAASFGTLRIE